MQENEDKSKKEKKLGAKYVIMYFNFDISSHRLQFTQRAFPDTDVTHLAAQFIAAFPLPWYGTVRFTFVFFSTGYSTWYLFLVPPRYFVTELATPDPT